MIKLLYIMIIYKENGKVKKKKINKISFGICRLEFVLSLCSLKRKLL